MRLNNSICAQPKFGRLISGVIRDEALSGLCVPAYQREVLALKIKHYPHWSVVASVNLATHPAVYTTINEPL
jgi:hypothetical protein